MLNMELIRSDFREKYAAALASADENAVADALTECSAAAQAQMVELAEEIRSDFTAATDSIVMAQRGVKTLNSAETKYWESVVSVMKDKPQSSGVAVVPEALPTTVVDRIFEDLVQEHQILNYINFQNVGLITRMLLSTDSGAAVWGDFKGVIEGELEGAVTAVSLDQYKLTAYFVIAEDMLELGPAWVANFITTVIGEKIAVGLELAIVDGDGNKKPIGMSRKLTGATDSVYPRKTAKKITDLSPATIGGLLKIISAGPKGPRPVPRLLLAVSPGDYYEKVYPATTVRSADGTFANNVVPYPMDIVPSAGVPAGRAIIGLASKYHMGIAAGKSPNIEYSDQYKFLEDVRVYKAKLFGFGTALDENAFVYLDISDLEPASVSVTVTNLSDIPAAGGTA